MGLIFATIPTRRFVAVAPSSDKIRDEGPTLRARRPLDADGGATLPALRVRTAELRGETMIKAGGCRYTVGVR